MSDETRPRKVIEAPVLDAHGLWPTVYHQAVQHPIVQFAAAIDDRNPWWPVMPELNAALTRLCWLLRQGEPVADVAVSE